MYSENRLASPFKPAMINEHRLCADRKTLSCMLNKTKQQTLNTERAAIFENRTGALPTEFAKGVVVPRQFCNQVNHA